MNIKNSTSLAIILMVVLAWFSPWWIGGKNLAPLDLQNRMMSPWRDGNSTRFAKNHIVSDGVDQYLVYRLIAEKSYREEGWVGWSSLTYGGTAQYANTMALYDDWTMQLHRWFKFWTAWHLGLMGQVMLAATGMFLFLQGRTIGSLWAVCGALAYAANSQFVTWIYHRWALGAFCWLPWILWAIDRHRRGKRLSWGLVPVFIAMAFLGGTLQHSALVVLAVAAMWLEEAVLQHSKSKNLSRQSRCPRPVKNSTSGIATQWRLLGRYAAWGILGTGLAAMMLVPCIDAFLTSNRLGLHTGMTANAANSFYPEGALQPLFNLAAYPFQIFPSVLGRCDSVDVLKLFKSELFYIAYFGSLPVLVAFLALWRIDSPVLARVLIGAGLILPLTPLVRLLYQRLFLLFILGGVFAFTHFMESAQRDTRLKVFKISSILTGLGIAGWSILSIGLHLHPEILSDLHEKILTAGAASSFGFFRDWISARADRFIGDLFIWSPQQWIPLLLLALGLLGLRLTASSVGEWRRNGALLVSLVVICEVSLFASRWVVWTDPADCPFFAETPDSRALEQQMGHEGRATTVIHPSAHMAVTPFIPNTLAPYGLATISGYDSIVPHGMLLPGEAAGDAEKLGRFGVSHLITWPGNPDVPQEWKPVWKSRVMALYENTLQVPRYMGFQSNEELNAFFKGGRPEFQPLHETSGKENLRSLVVPAGVGWIRIAENHADGWRYRSGHEGAWQPVARATDASMLIHNPDASKDSQMEMHYDPPLRRLGMMVSGVSLLLLLGSSIRIAWQPQAACS